MFIKTILIRFIFLCLTFIIRLQDFSSFSELDYRTSHCQCRNQMVKLLMIIPIEVSFQQCRRFFFVSKSCINDSRSFLVIQKIECGLKGRLKSRRKQISRRRAVDHKRYWGVVERLSSSMSFQRNARGTEGPGKEATECICPTRTLNHPGNFSVDNWLPALEPNGWLTHFNVPSLPRENDMVASEATSVTNHVIFIVVCIDDDGRS